MTLQARRICITFFVIEKQRIYSLSVNIQWNLELHGFHPSAIFLFLWIYLNLLYQQIHQHLLVRIIHKKGHKVDSSLKRGSDESDDISAYDLILKDKERLLSFENPVRFIFSHSALREGWDNPNVFQICTLKHGGSSPTQKRQEVGRGLRLCVNQNGERQDYDTLGSQVQKINQLTVIASDGYKDFVADLQKGIREDLYDRPTQATAEYFIGKTLNIGGSDVTVSDKQGRDIYRYLIKNDYIDEDDHVTDKYRADLANDALAPVPESCTEITDGVHALIQSIFDEHALDDMISDGHETKIQENALNDNFYKKEFQTLWNYINHKYAYTVEFDSDELIRKAIAHIDDKMFVAKLQYTVTTGQQQDDMNSDALKNGASFVAEKSKTYTLERAEGSAVKYDLVGKIAEGAKLTRRSAAKILAGIRPYTFAMFKNNPEEFITKAIRLINEQKATMIVEQITYNQTDGSYDSSIFTAEKNTDFSKAYHAKKNVQDYVFADGYAKDGQSIERQFAESMDLADEVCVYAKLPKGFSIPTPVGNYSPDWAIAFNKGTVKHIFFVAETKGTMDSLNLKPIEQAKIACAKKLFSNLSSADVVYRCKLIHHGQRCAVAPIADAPDSVDEDFACAAAGEIHAAVAMIQINVKPETCVIAFHPMCSGQRPERAVIGIAGENVHDLRKRRRVSRISFLCGCVREVLGVVGANNCNRIALRLQGGKAVRPEHITDTGKQQKRSSYQNHPARTQLFDHFSTSSGTRNTRIALQELVTEKVTGSQPSFAFSLMTCSISSAIFFALGA